MTLVRWNPARELFNVEREFRKLFNDFEGRFGVKKNDQEDEYENAVWAPLTDISEDKDTYRIHLDLPGVKKEDVKISFEDGKLNIAGERKQEKESDDSKYHRIERVYGKYFRTFNLPKEIKADEISANYKEGTLTISIPKAEEVKPKEIEIKIS